MSTTPAQLIARAYLNMHPGGSCPMHNQTSHEPRLYGGMKGTLSVPLVGCIVQRRLQQGGEDYWLVVGRKLGGKFKWVTRLYLCKITGLCSNTAVLDPSQTLELVPAHMTYFHDGSTHCYWRNEQQEEDIFTPGALPRLAASA